MKIIVCAKNWSVYWVIRWILRIEFWSYVSPYSLGCKRAMGKMESWTRVSRKGLIFLRSSTLSWDLVVIFWFLYPSLSKWNCIPLLIKCFLAFWNRKAQRSINISIVSIFWKETVWKGWWQFLYKEDCRRKRVGFYLSYIILCVFLRRFYWKQFSWVGYRNYCVMIPCLSFICFILPHVWQKEYEIGIHVLFSFFFVYQALINVVHFTIALISFIFFPNSLKCQRNCQYPTFVFCSSKMCSYVLDWVRLHA